MGFQFRPAVRSQTSLLVGLAGPSGSGKTLSALKMARGMVGGNDAKIFVIDTEAGRALHYACAAGEQPGPSRFKFQHADLSAPFSPPAYADAIGAAVKAGAGVVIVDSMSHEHEGAGGILEMHEAVLQRMAGSDYAKRERLTFAAWIEPKAAHNKFVNSILQQRAHLIFCFRAKDKMKLVKNERGKMEPIQLGWTAICADRLEYEMACLLMLPPNGKGVPDLAAPSTKLQEAHRGLFQAGKPIGEEAGKALAAWARGAPAAQQSAATPPAAAPAPESIDPDTGEVTEPEPPPAEPATAYDAVREFEALLEGAMAEETAPALKDYGQVQSLSAQRLREAAPDLYQELHSKVTAKLKTLKNGSIAA